MIQSLFREWRGETCVIVASGPSAVGIDIAQARGRTRFIAINASWRLAPWADILFGCDYAWWHSVGGCPEFQGLKLCADDRARHEGWGVEIVGLRKGDDRLVFDEPGTVGWGGNSGFHALNLAVQFGCRRIVLVGYDMRIDQGVHWHGPHAAGLNNPRPNAIAGWRRSFDQAAKVLKAKGVEVLNASPISALECFPKVKFEEIFP